MHRAYQWKPGKYTYSTSDGCLWNFQPPFLRESHLHFERQLLLCHDGRCSVDCDGRWRVRLLKDTVYLHRGKRIHHEAPGTVSWMFLILHAQTIRSEYALPWLEMENQACRNDDFSLGQCLFVQHKGEWNKRKQITFQLTNRSVFFRRYIFFCDFVTVNEPNLTTTYAVAVFVKRIFQGWTILLY